MSRTVRAALLAVLSTLALAAPAAAASPDIVVSQVYGGGGNTGAPLRNDFIELFNRGTGTVDVSGWSVQYASATGVTWARTNLTGTIAPGRHYLVQEAAGANTAAPLLPTPDATGTIAMSATSGKVALVTSQTPLPCGATCATAPGVRDFVGYGTANDSEGLAAAPLLTNATADLRNGGGCADTDNNAADFATGSPAPRNSQDPASVCAGSGDAAPLVAGSQPGNGDTDVDPAADLRVTFSEPVTADGDAFSLTCNGATVALGVTRDGPPSYVLHPQASLPEGASCVLRVAGDRYHDDDTNDPPDTGSDYAATFTTRGITGLRIHDIQGRQHVSPYNRALVAGVPGVVTARRTNGYFLQDPQPDADDRTSEGIFVFTGSAPPSALQPGTAVTVSGRVSEFRPGGSTSANLSTTELTSAVATVTGTGTIAPTIVGRGGRVPPATVIDDDTVDPGGEDPPTVSGDVEAKSRPAPAGQDPTFDPEQDGIDFYESLEGMLVEVRDAVAVGPTSDFGSNRELPVVADGGAGATVLAARGPLVVRGFDQTPPQEYRRGDFNPERIILNDTGDPEGRKVPIADVRDRFTAPVRAVVDYNFGNFKFLAVNAPPVADGGLQPERTRPRGREELAIASYNVENLDGLDDQARYDRIAAQITANLRSPDILSLEEIQDDDGTASAAPTDAGVTHRRLIAAIEAAGGPTYDYRQVDPAPNQDGGQPNGNIRVSFLFRTDRRDLTFVDRPGATAVTPTEPVPGDGGRARLTLSPGRVDPTNPVFANSRKPLAGEFRYRGRPLFVVGNHFNSKGGDDPVFGRFQEPRRPSELQRRGSATDPSDTTRGQAGVVNRFVQQILAIDDRARVVVLGDLNDFDFSETVRVLETGVDTSDRELVDLWSELPPSERYSYIFQGNAQTLDHILVTPALLAAGRPDFDSVHINAEFADQASDHDPPITRLAVHGGGRGHDGGGRGHDDRDDDEDR